MSLFLSFSFFLCLLELAESWTALVLSGGGAKGAFELGVLEAMCDKSSSWADSYDMVLGTSIGALNAGILAQFSKSEQCSKGVPALGGYWDSIKSQDDVFKAHYGNSCLSVTGMPSAFIGFKTKGGMCDPQPGTDRYNAAVKKENIQNSGMKLRVVASDLLRGEPRWWSESDDSIVDGCMASGSIAPFVYPKNVDNRWYVDGGIFSNTPIGQALREGADSVLATLLSATNDPDRNVTDIDGQKKEWLPFLGFSVISYYMTIVSDRVFLDNDIRAACRDFPNARIYGFTPTSDLGDLLAFDAPNLAALRSNGSKVAQSPPVDLCVAIAADRGRSSNVIVTMVITALVSFVIGICSTMLYVKRERVRQCWSPPATELANSQLSLRINGDA